MKSLIAGIVLIVVVGFAAFLYRNVAERTGGPEPVACTMEAKLCPDGTGVGRTGPSCEFAPCPLPNVEFPNERVAFVLPEGYHVASKDEFGGGLVSLLNAYALASAGGVPHVIAVYAYPIPEGKTAEDVMVANTRRLTADMPIESMDEFESIIVDGVTFHFFTADRFEAQVVSYFYLPRASDVLRFEIIEHDVTEWTSPDLVILNLPQHKTLLGMLATLQVGQ